MNKQIDVVAKAQVLLEALPYIQRFKGFTFVIKYGGAFMDDPNPSVKNRVITDIVFLASVGIRVVIVHGGGKAISRALKKSGIETKFIHGLRYTDKDSVQIVKETLNENVNSEIAELLLEKNANPVRLRGNEILKCTKAFAGDPAEPIDLGFVGNVTDVETSSIQEALDNGAIPIISPIAEDEDGNTYNTNADVAASQVAQALNARRLVFLCDVPGLLKDPNDHSTVISSLKVGDIDQLKKDGVISSGMLPKVQSAVNALNADVRRVHFIDGYLPHSLLLEIFTDKGIGTEIVH